MNVLLLGFAFALPYHVMRCAAAAGHQITVLGSGPAQNLLRSPSCADLYLSDFDYRSQDYEILIQEIAHLSIAIGFDLVMPSDAVSTRALAAIKSDIPLPTTPLPTVEAFDTLNDRARFARFCDEHGIPTATTGTQGDRFGVTALCAQGQVAAHVVERSSNLHFRIHDRPDVIAAVAQLVAAAGFSGMLHGDAVIDHAGVARLTGCQPYFSPSIHPMMIAGLNWADATINLAHGGTPAMATLPPQTIRLHPPSIWSLAISWRLPRKDRQMLRYHWRERELLGIRIDDSDVFVRSVDDAASPTERLAS